MVKSNHEKKIESMNTISKFLVYEKFDTYEVIDLLMSMIATLFAELKLPAIEIKGLFEDVLIQYHNHMMENHGRK